MKKTIISLLAFSIIQCTTTTETNPIINPSYSSTQYAYQASQPASQATSQPASQVATRPVQANPDPFTFIPDSPPATQIATRPVVHEKYNHKKKSKKEIYDYYKNHPEQLGIVSLQDLADWPELGNWMKIHPQDFNK